METKQGLEKYLIAISISEISLVPTAKSDGQEEQ